MPIIIIDEPCDCGRGMVCDGHCDGVATTEARKTERMGPLQLLTIAVESFLMRWW